MPPVPPTNRPHDHIRYEIADGIGVVTLDRPEARNALTLEMYDGLAEIARSIAADGDVKVLVFTGAGEKAFAAGTDISVFRDFGTRERALDYETHMDEVLGAIERCAVPTIAAIAGACTGGGAAIAACCDLRVATRDMRFGFPIARTLGNCLSITNLSRLTALIGAGRTREILFTARLIGGEEALATGLVSELFDTHAAMMSGARALAGKLMGHAPLTLRATKEAMRRMSQDRGADDADLIAMCYTSEDFREGLTSFLAKRPPRWTGH